MHEEGAMTEMPEEGPRKEVLAVTREEARSINTGDIEAYLAILTDDAAFLPPGDAAKTGVELRGWLKAFLEEVTVEALKYDTQELVVSGDLAYHWYEFSWKLTPKAGGEPTPGRGKGIHILRRGPDGCWKLAREIWNASSG
jgi:ketosteroid isomerase-like protein